MNSAIYTRLFAKNKKTFALLIDPEKQSTGILISTLDAANKSAVDVILVGGSLTSGPIDETISVIKNNTDIPVVLFPGNLLQLSSKADGILLLSLLSGRNSEYLIGNHVMAAQYLRKSGLEIIPTGYLLVGGNCFSSVEYMSNTKPIPADKTDIIVSTALAGEQLGLKLIYLEAGSGAMDSINQNVIDQVRENLTIPLIVGGGIKKPDDIRKIYQAGANGVVVGTVVEKDYTKLQILAAVREEFN